MRPMLQSLYRYWLRGDYRFALNTRDDAKNEISILAHDSGCGVGVDVCYTLLPQCELDRRDAEIESYFAAGGEIWE